MAGVIMNKTMKMLEIEEVIEENEIIRSFYFTDETISKAEPAQFVMLWIPLTHTGDVNFEIPDQIPMSVSSVEGDRFALTVRKYGLTTQELFTYKKGDIVGMTGPLGRGYFASGNRILCIAGGTGAAPLLLLVQNLQHQKKEVHFILGAKTKSELFFQEKLEGLCSSLCITTDDGSCGKKGFACDPVEEFCENHAIDQIYCCGPEIMMHRICETALKLGIPAQFSLERYMYCGLGICGHCTLNGYLVCKDGPVFTSEELKDVKDFGTRKVDETGRKIPI